jgi:hypothetical protein
MSRTSALPDTGEDRSTDIVQSPVRWLRSAGSDGVPSYGD